MDFQAHEIRDKIQINYKYSLGGQSKFFIELMKNKKGYTMGIYLSILAFGIVLGLGIMFYLFYAGHLTSFLPASLLPAATPAP